MGCDNCPDEKVVDGVFYIIYTGGPPNAPFIAMQAAMDKIAATDEGLIRLYRPKIQKDGSIKYEKDAPEPPVPEGYVRDECDPYVLRPVWTSCQYRAFRLRRQDDGLLKIDGLCGMPSSGVPANMPVSNAKCRLCKVGAAIGSFPAITGKIGALTALGDPPAS